ncbi:hypothetical protein PROFUN_10621 [Planoprotostelium fungivorum]|uniref:Protein kinase domain-containing protein n=1 Tax=Planoprotostelium fungivorum TaxID=1890364 RepID=A0A2P6ND76_9EUKA|nr:hypothetical protein PROFUN_10621 [Planoprotostelium fungivorum]
MKPLLLAIGFINTVLSLAVYQVNTTNFQDVLNQSVVGSDADISIVFEGGEYNCNESYTWTSKQISIQGSNSTVLTDCYFYFYGGNNQSFRISDLTFFNYSLSWNTTGAVYGQAFYLQRVRYVDNMNTKVYSRMPTFVDDCLFTGATSSGGLLVLDRAPSSLVSNTIFRDSPFSSGIEVGYGSALIYLLNISVTLNNIAFDNLYRGILPSCIDFTSYQLTVTAQHLNVTLSAPGATLIDDTLTVFYRLHIKDSFFQGGDGTATNLMYATSGPSEVTLTGCSFTNIHMQPGGAIFHSKGNAKLTLTDVTVRNLTGIVYRTDAILIQDLDVADSGRPPSSLFIRNSIFENIKDGFSAGESYSFTVKLIVTVFTMKTSNVDVENSSFIDISTRQGALYHQISGVYQSGITIRNSRFTRVVSSIDGGAISLTGVFSNVSLSEVQFEGNTAVGAGGSLFISGAAERIELKNIVARNGRSRLDGGHIYLGVSSAGLITVDNCTLTVGNAETNGGAISITGVDTNMTLSNLNMTSNAAVSRGGAISCKLSAGRLDLYNVSVSNSNAVSGGAIFLRGTPDQVTLNGVELTKNTAKNQGGGIYLGTTGNGMISLDDVSMTGSSALYGGAIASLATMQEIRLTNNFISTSSAQQGAGLYFSPLGSISLLNIRNTNVTNNEALLDGGMVYVSGIHQVAIDQVQILHNSAGQNGGAVCISASQGSIIHVDINNSSVQYNKAASGGGISVTSGKTVMNAKNSSFSRNSADNDGGALSYQGNDDGGMLNVSASIMLQNTANVGGAIASSGTILRTNDVTMDSNTASLSGGAIYSVGTSISTKRQTTVRLSSSNDRYNNNTAGQGGGAYVIGNAIVTSTVFDGNHGNGSDINTQRGSVSLYGSSLKSEGFSLYVGTTSTVKSQDTVIDEVYLSSMTSSLQANGIGSDSLSLTCSPGQNLTRNNGGTYSCQSNVVGTTSSLIYRTNTDQRAVGIAAGVSVGFFVIIAAIAAFFIVRRYRQQRRELENAKHSNEFDMQELVKIDLGDAKRCLLDFDELKDLQLIGKGSFGVVYRATWRQLTVAVKQIISDSVSAEQLKDFLSEVAILQSIRSHPNVVSFTGLTFPPQPLSLVTEFCHGGGLDSYLTKNDTPLEVLKGIMRGIALGMNHLHSEGIIHRDLAVRNILLTQHLEPKVSDFGFSRRTDEGSGVTQTTIGPVRWMAPEAIISQAYSTKSDAFSFGVLVWEMITGGKVPYEELETVEAALAVIQGTRPAIPSDFDDRDLIQLMTLCWGTQPEFRPDFGTILDRYLSDVTRTPVENLGGEVVPEQDDKRYTSPHGLDGDATYAAVPAIYTATKEEDSAYSSIPGRSNHYEM